MEATELRVHLLERIKNADDEQLRIIKELLDNFEQGRPLADSLEGQPKQGGF